MSALVPYVGKPRSGPRTGIHRGFEKQRIYGRPDPLPQRLSDLDQDRALNLFRDGKDTRDIASILNCTEAAAANAVARARDAEREQ